MSNIDAWTTLVALLTPYVVALINQPSWSRTTKRFVMMGVAVLVALGNDFFRGGFDNWNWSNLLVYLVTFVGAVQAAYSVLEAIPITNKVLDKTELALGGPPPETAAAQKQAVNAEAVKEFRDNVAA